MADFEQAITIVLAHEGRYTNDIRDSGGETKYGISHASYPDIDIKNLTIEKAKEIYKNCYWDVIKGNEIHDQAIANKLMDLAVNMGCKNAVRCAQRAFRAVSSFFTAFLLIEDGIVGVKTLDALNRVKEDVYLAALKSEAAGYYRSLNNPAFIHGWLNRAYS